MLLAHLCALFPLNPLQSPHPLLFLFLQVQLQLLPLSVVIHSGKVEVKVLRH